MGSYRRLHGCYPQRELYFVHTSREELDIEERRWLGIRGVWDATLARSQNQLDRLADNALAEFRAGKTSEMSLDLKKAHTRREAYPKRGGMAGGPWTRRRLCDGGRHARGGGPNLSGSPSSSTSGTSSRDVSRSSARRIRR